MSETLQKAKEGAIWGMLIADALSMPVHWYYNPADIKSSYGGWLSGYNAPAKRHPSSILTLSAVGKYSNHTSTVLMTSFRKSFSFCLALSTEDRRMEICNFLS